MNVAPPSTRAVTSFSVIAKAKLAPMPSLPDVEFVFTNSSDGLALSNTAKKRSEAACAPFDPSALTFTSVLFEAVTVTSSSTLTDTLSPISAVTSFTFDT